MDGRTDRQTDGRTDGTAISISRVAFINECGQCGLAIKIESNKKVAFPDMTARCLHRYSAVYVNSAAFVRTRKPS